MNASAFLILLLLTPAVHAESFKSWAARASREEREKNDKDAFQSYSNALSAWKPTDGKPARAKILCARGTLRDRGGDENGALEDYTDCLTVDKKNAKVFHRRGQLRLKSGKVSAAIDDFYKATALDIRFGAAYADRAKAYELQGDPAFAGEDYRHACDLGVKAACPKAKELAPARKSKKKNPAAPPPAEKNKEGAIPDDAGAAVPAAEPADEPAPPKRARRLSSARTYSPKFGDCLSSLQSCVDKGSAFGDCVGNTPACEQKSVKGCCPGACLEAYRKSLNRGVSEAESYRDIFIPEATCAAPPKSDDD